MYPVIQILLSQGHTITGSDVNEGTIIDRERAQGVTVYMGHQAHQVDGADLVVYSAAIRADNAERKHAEQSGILTVERSEMLGYLESLYRRALAVGGTHGKTTVTSMAVQILEMGGHQPGAIIGGNLPLINGYGQAGKGDAMVIEACEYNNTFLQLAPDTAVLLNIGNDHLEFFGSMENLQNAFAAFCNKATGAVVYNADDERCREVAKGIDKPLISFGFSDDADWHAHHLREYRPGRWAFTLAPKGHPETEILLDVPGKFNVLNATAAAVGAVRMGASLQDCKKGLEAFGGAGGRFELIGERGGVTIMDDYAHHPTELKEVLTTANALGYNKVWAVFQPYTFSRTEQLLDDFAAVLPLADRVVMTAIMGGRERAEDYTITTEALAQKVPGSVWFETQREVARYVMENAKPGDLALTLGCGDIYKAAHMMADGDY